jgi:hypothetical protein
VAGLGLSVKGAGGTYLGPVYTMKLEFGVIGADGEAATAASRDFDRCAGAFGLKGVALGDTFESGGKTFTISGLAPRKRKRPLLATWNGRTFCFPASDVIRLMGKTPSF